MSVSQDFKNGKISVYFHQLSFLTTGVCSTLGVQWLFYTGAASGSSFFTQLAGCVGSMLAGLIIPKLLVRPPSTISAIPEVVTTVTEKGLEDEALDGFAVINLHESKGDQDICAVSDGSVKHLAVARLAVLDIAASSFVTVGFSLIGSGMYQVIFSSVVVWAAILSYVFMRRELSISQWISICGTSAGLTLCAMDSMGVHEESNTGLSLGTSLTLGGTFLYACVYVYGDHILSKQKPSLSPLKLCFYNGLYCTLITLIYIALYTMPRLDQLIHIDPLVPGSTIWGMYLFVTVINATHSWNYYQLLESTGSVATGILQAIRAVLVYAISHFWYCSTDSAQCFTVNKGCGSLLVIGCVLLFKLGSKSNK